MTKEKLPANWPTDWPASAALGSKLPPEWEARIQAEANAAAAQELGPALGYIAELERRLARPEKGSKPLAAQVADAARRHPTLTEAATRLLVFRMHHLKESEERALAALGKPLPPLHARKWEHFRRTLNKYAKARQAAL